MRRPRRRSLDQGQHIRFWPEPKRSPWRKLLFVGRPFGLAAVLGASLTNAAIAIGLAQLPNFIRVVRGETLRSVEQDYVSAAIAAGARDTTVMFRHVLPNSWNALLVQITVAIPQAIISESLLSFLGLGVPPGTPSWGALVDQGTQYLLVAPHVALFPGLAIAVAVLGFNLLGDGLRDRLDPRDSRRRAVRAGS